MRAVQVGWHHRTVVAAVLPVVGLAQFNPGDLGDGIRLVGRLQRSLQQLAFRHRLPCQFRIDTGRTEKQQFVHVVQVRGVNNVALYHHVFINKIRRIRVVGDNAAYFRRRQINLVDTRPGKERLYRTPVEQIQLIAGAQYQFHVAALRKLPYNGGSHHPAMARHKIRCLFILRTPARWPPRNREISAVSVFSRPPDRSPPSRRPSPTG